MIAFSFAWSLAVGNICGWITEADSSEESDEEEDDSDKASDFYYYFIICFMVSKSILPF